MSSRVWTNVELAPLGTFRIGGRAEYFCWVKKPENLVATIELARKAGMAYHICAAGSNVVFPDRQLKGLLIRILGGKFTFDGKTCTAEAGVTLMDVIDGAISRGLGGLETLSGIPGTVGGAIVGNAGAFGHSISEVVEKVEIWDGREQRWVTNSDCHFAYRESVFKKEPWLVLRALLRFKPGNRAVLSKTSRRIVATRRKRYTSGLRCPGSFFKNVLVRDVPQRSLELIDPSKITDGKIPAGWLLDQVGARGMTRGGIRIASFHGNLFMNGGLGSARDVRQLATILKARVRKRFGIELEEEIRYF